MTPAARTKELIEACRKQGLKIEVRPPLQVTPDHYKQYSRELEARRTQRISSPSRGPSPTVEAQNPQPPQGREQFKR